MKTQIKVPRQILKRHHESTRQFKQRKRSEARLIEKEVEIFRLDRAFTPVAELANELRLLVRRVREELKVKHWGN